MSSLLVRIHKEIMYQSSISPKVMSRAERLLMDVREEIERLRKPQEKKPSYCKLCGAAYSHRVNGTYFWDCGTTRGCEGSVSQAVECRLRAVEREILRIKIGMEREERGNQP